MLAFALSGVYAIADGFFVGNAMGDQALAAINVAYPVTAFIQAAGTGLGMGGAVLYSIHAGSGDRQRARQYFGMSFLLLCGASVLLTVLFLAAAPVLLEWFGASGQILALSREYLRYITYGAVFQIMGTGLVPMIRNMGGSIPAMVSMAAGFFTNITLDYLFVWVFPWQMRGAAVATVAGQAVTLAVCLAFFAAKKERPSFAFADRKGRLAGQILVVGLSPFGLTFSPNITLILINKSAALVGGNMAVTCYAAVSYISSVVILLLQGVSDGCQPLLSYSFGQGERALTRRYRDWAYAFAFAVAAVCMGVLLALRGSIAGLFGASGQVSDQVAAMLPAFMTGYLFVSVSRVSTAYFYATGKNLWSYLLIYGEPLALGLLLLFLPALAGGIWGTWLAVPLSQLAAMALSLLLVLLARRQERE